MAGPDFVHLHTHSEFSLLDGAARVEPLVHLAAKQGMSALALTDHGVMYGAFAFHRACRKAGIKPIIGVEAYVTPGSHRDRTPRGVKAAYHLLLLAANEIGYKNLLKLTTIAAVEGFYTKPRIDHALLQQHREGLIVTSACLGGEVCTALMQGDYERARDIAALYRDMLGPENYYIELQDHTLPKQRQCNEGLLRIARELGLRLLCTNDVHYLTRDDAEAHDVLLCIGTGATTGDAARLRYEAEEFYLKSAEQMAEIFRDHPEALATTVEIAERCNVEIPERGAALPTPECPDGLTPMEYLRRLAHEGLERKVGGAAERYLQRLEHELDVVQRTGFAEYFLIVRDFARFASEKGIFFGVRGSAAGSLTSYCIGITDIDPVDYGLTFERFLNIDRVQMPDIDMDFEDTRRAEVIDYVTQKYGKDHVAQIITFGTLAARAALKDAGRALNIPLAEVNRIVSLVPTKPGTKLQDVLASSEEFRAAYNGSPSIRRLVDTAIRLEGLSRHASVHAAGVVISKDPLVNYTPLQRSADSGLVTQYGADALEALGLLKMDFLGLINLSILSRALENIRRTRNIEIDLRSLPLDDPKAFELLGRGDTTGIFQLESEGMRRNISQLRPTSVRDLAAMVALYRPGPLEHIQEFIRAKHGQAKIRYPHPLLEPILKETYGVIVYQDQVMQIAQAIAGFTLAQADILRRAMGKKQQEYMASQHAKFVQGAAERGIDAAKAEEIFKLIEPFAGYAFNKAHAVCYAMLAYQTAYLKANYPIEYMAALLTCYIEKKDKVANCLTECRRLGLRILPPDINHSESDFRPEGEAIRFGLSAIKNVGSNAVEAILKERKEGGPFQSLVDFTMRMAPHGSINRATCEALIGCGAFDSLVPSRRAVMAMLDQALAAASRSLRDQRAGQVGLFEGSLDLSNEFVAIPVISLDQDYPLSQRLATEKELLGIYLSGHPLERYQERLAREKLTPLSSLPTRKGREEVQVAGLISQVVERTQKEKGQKWARFTLEDYDGHTVEVLAFARVYAEHAEKLAKDNVVIVTGTILGAEESSEEEEARSVEVRATDIRLVSRANGVQKRRLRIELSPDRTPLAVLQQLRRILEQAPGEDEAYVVVRCGPSQTTAAFEGRRCRVCVNDDLVRQIHDVTRQYVGVE